MRLDALAGRGVAAAVTKYRKRRESHLRYVTRPLAPLFSGKVLATAVHLYACDFNYSIRVFLFAVLACRPLGSQTRYGDVYDP